jgi:hypothetical protein
MMTSRSMRPRRGATSLPAFSARTVAEVVARGAPRAAGFDLSQRAGEQSLMPFSQFLTDKRQWREASTEMALRSYGAPVSMLLNILQGGEKIGSGDVIGGLTAAAPMALKGPLQSYLDDDGRLRRCAGQQVADDDELEQRS